MQVVQALITSVQSCHYYSHPYVQYSKNWCHSQKDQKLVFKTNYPLIRRMLQVEHSAILLTFIISYQFVLSMLEWPFYTGSTVCS